MSTSILDGPDLATLVHLALREDGVARDLTSLALVPDSARARGRIVARQEGVIAGMPLVLQGVTFLVPARYFVVVTRGVLLKGVGVAAMWPQALAMIVFAVVGLTLATRVFKKEIKV